MSVWFVIPSKRPPEEVEPVVKQWRERGYKVALWRDDLHVPSSDLCMSWTCGYPGYAAAVNSLAADVLSRDPECQWIVTGGDDVLPDPNHSAEEIALECSRYFGIKKERSDGGIGYLSADGSLNPNCLDTFGVMQPTGDRWSDSKGPYIERVAGSPWMGREWCLRAHGGRGPLHPGFTHMFVDEALQGVAEHLGVFWQRPDLEQRHMHWGRPRPGERMAPNTRMPEFLRKWNTEAHWKESKALFERLKAEEWKECLPI